MKIHSGRLSVSRRTVPADDGEVIADDDAVPEEDRDGEDPDDEPALPRPLVVGAALEVIDRPKPAVQQGHERRELESEQDQRPRHVRERRATHGPEASSPPSESGASGSPGVARGPNVPWRAPQRPIIPSP